MCLRNVLCSLKLTSVLSEESVDMGIKEYELLPEESPIDIKLEHGFPLVLPPPAAQKPSMLGNMCYSNKAIFYSLAVFCPPGFLAMLNFPRTLLEVTTGGGVSWGLLSGSHRKRKPVSVKRSSSDYFYS